MDTKEIVQWLRNDNAGHFRPSTKAAKAADLIERMEQALKHLSECNLSEYNCGTFEAANRKIRNIANSGLWNEFPMYDLTRL